MAAVFSKTAFNQKAFSRTAFNFGLTVTVIVETPTPTGQLAPGGGHSKTFNTRTRRTVRVNEFNREEIIRQLVREDEELIAIVISATENQTWRH
jgi:hypothetical protein